MKPTSGKRSATTEDRASLRVVFDGWPLARDPGGPSALHLLELIEALPAPHLAFLALPDTLPDVPRLKTITESTPDSAAGRLRWEQHTLPALARRCGGHILHTTSAFPPLASRIPVVHSPVDSPEAQAQSGAVNRLRAALGRGGESAACAVLWPADLPAPESGGPLYRLSPHAHPAFRQPQARPPGFAEDYLYAPAPPAGRLDLLAAAWSWVSAGLGEDWALVVSGLSERQIADLRRQCAAAGAAGPVQPAAPRAPAEHAALIQHAGAVLPLAAPRPWADPYLQALAGGRPLAAEETALASARVGPAGYLTPPGDARLLGAAALTVLVEEQVAETLARAAEERARGWLIPAFGDRLVEVYRQVLREEAA